METSRYSGSISSRDVDNNGTFNRTHFPDTTPQSLAVVAIPALMFAGGVLGNVIALFVLYRSNKEHNKTVFYQLVRGLACTDLFGIFATSPVTIMVYLNGRHWIGGQGLCNYFSFMMIFSGMATVMIVGSMAVERYTALLHPFKYASIFSAEKVKYILASVWFFGFIVGCLPLVGLGRNVLQYPGTWCFFDRFCDDVTAKIFTYFYATIGLLVITLTVICNVTVMCVLSRMRSQHHSVARPTQRGEMDDETQMMVLLAGIIFVFATCYAPLMVRIIINQTGKFTVNHSTDLWVIRLASLNQILDPWVYILFRRQTLDTLWRLVKCVLCHKRCRTSKEPTKPGLSVENKLKHQTHDVGDAEHERSFLKLHLLQRWQTTVAACHCCKSSARKSVTRNGSGRMLIPMIEYGSYGRQSSFPSTAAEDGSPSTTTLVLTLDKECSYRNEDFV